MGSNKTIFSLEKLRKNHPRLFLLFLIFALLYLVGTYLLPYEQWHLRERETTWLYLVPYLYFCLGGSILVAASAVAGRWAGGLIGAAWAALVFWLHHPQISLISFSPYLLLLHYLFLGLLIGAIKDVLQLKQHLVNQKEEILRQVYNSLSIGIALAKLPDGNIIYANEVVRKMLGLKEKKLQGLRLFDYIKEPEERRKLKEEFTRLPAQTNLTFTQEIELVTADGETRQVVMHISALPHRPHYYLVAINDVTSYSNHLKQWADNAFGYHTVFNQIGDAIFLLQQKEGGLIVEDANYAAEQLLGRSMAEIKGQPLTRLLSQTQVHRVQEMYKKALANGKAVTFQETILSTQGKRVLLATITPIKSLTGKLSRRAALAIKEITALQMFEEKIAYLATHDELTGLYNRHYFNEKMNELENKGIRPVSLIYCDLDGLKIINDTLGHSKGDETLKAAASIIARTAPPGSVVARIGGDEFAILISGAGEAEAANVTENIYKQSVRFNFEHYPAYLINISTGYATAREGTLLQEALAQADGEAYLNKVRNSLQTRTSLVEWLIVIVQRESPLFRQHSDRVKALADLFTPYLTLTPEQQDLLLQLSMLHDIGILGMPAELLARSLEEKLSPEESKRLHNHPLLGQRILQNLPDVFELPYLVLCHHEHWDGSGYPTGLQGERIPYLSRALAIIDAYDLLTAPSPYGRNLSPYEALNVIKREAGRRFDPVLVELFVRCWREQLASIK